MTYSAPVVTFGRLSPMPTNTSEPSAPRTLTVSFLLSSIYPFSPLGLSSSFSCTSKKKQDIVATCLPPHLKGGQWTPPKYDINPFSGVNETIYKTSDHVTNERHFDHRRPEMGKVNVRDEGVNGPTTPVQVGRLWIPNRGKTCWASSILVLP